MEFKVLEQSAHRLCFFAVELLKHLVAVADCLLDGRPLFQGAAVFGLTYANAYSILDCDAHVADEGLQLCIFKLFDGFCFLDFLF
jgi:hypothetical protein